MKAIKLFLIFVVLLGGVLGAFYLFTKSDSRTLPPPLDTTYQTFRTQFEKDWEQVGDWDDNLFMSHCDLIQQLSRKFETKTLQDLNTQTAIEVVYKKIFDEWASSSCQKATIEKYIDAVKFIESKDVNANSDSNVRKIKNVYSTYLSAYDLAHKSIGLSPSFNGSGWNSFAKYRESMLDKRKTIWDDYNYKEYLSNISEIKNGLDAMTQKLSDARTRFYNNLATKIINYYSKIYSDDRTRSELNSLRNVKTQYENEYSSNSDLSSFARKFAEDVEYNEKKIYNYE